MKSTAWMLVLLVLLASSVFAEKAIPIRQEGGIEGDGYYVHFKIKRVWHIEIIRGTTKFISAPKAGFSVTPQKALEKRMNELEALKEKRAISIHTWTMFWEEDQFMYQLDWYEDISRPSVFITMTPTWTPGNSK